MVDQLSCPEAAPKNACPTQTPGRAVSDLLAGVMHWVTEMDRVLTMSFRSFDDGVARVCHNCRHQLAVAWKSRGRLRREALMTPNGMPSACIPVYEPGCRPCLR
jgi:hypothetical protein